MAQTNTIAMYAVGVSEKETSDKKIGLLLHILEADKAMILKRNLTHTELVAYLEELCSKSGAIPVGWVNVGEPVNPLSSDKVLCGDNYNYSFFDCKADHITPIHPEETHVMILAARIIRCEFIEEVKARKATA